MPTDRNFNIRLGDRRREKLRRIAEHQELSMSDVVRNMIDAAPEPDDFCTHRHAVRVNGELQCGDCEFVYPKGDSCAHVIHYRTNDLLRCASCGIAIPTTTLPLTPAAS